MNALLKITKTKYQKQFLFLLSLFHFFAVKVINEWKSGSYIGREGGMQSTVNVEGKGEVLQCRT